jgi:hypothetical protein
MKNKTILDKLSRANKIGLELYPWYSENIGEQMSYSEYDMIEQAIEHVDVKDKIVNVLNSGIGFYSVSMLLEAGAKFVRLIDMDPGTKDLAYILHHEENWEFYVKNIAFDWQCIPSADVWINLSCEHNYPEPKMFNEGKHLVLLSGNSLTKRGHINKINSCDELAEQYNIIDIIDSYETVYEDDGIPYTQYTIIGYAQINL